MPKRTDIKKIMLIGSGPIVIGQACEFDYSGVQACKALKEEGYEVVLVNSNPATIMTDPEFADRTYIEPLTADVLTEVIRRERPDALLPTLGGQTALNLAMELEQMHVLSRYNVEMIGARAAVIRKAEDRNLFKQAMANIGLETPVSASAHNIEEALKIRDRIGGYPLVIRPGFTLGGTGGGIAYNDSDFEEITKRGLFCSPTSEILIEESVIGWKEFELEVMRDHKDNCVIVCSIENLDPMGVHTGDSITVAPVQTLTDREYQIMRDAAIAVMREIGVDTGGSNVQFALNPENGRMVAIEMNPRVSRSSALASKATGFPIAKIAAKLAVGYTLDELSNDITRQTPACFEPAIDYVVTKVPRFAFEKFTAADDTLGTQMKSVGETMSIGRTFKESIQKALRSLEIGRAGFGADGKDGRFEAMTDDQLEAGLRRPTASRLFIIRSALKRGWSVEKVGSLTRIDRWFLNHLAELAAFEEEIKTACSIRGLKEDRALFLQAKEFGYSDRQIAWLLGCKEADVRHAGEEAGIAPVYGLVDTCAAEFTAFTPYFYSTYSFSGDDPMPSAAPSGQNSVALSTESSSARQEPRPPLINQRCLQLPGESEPPGEPRMTGSCAGGASVAGAGASASSSGGGRRKIMIIGGGPNRIGQGIEFDYCCVHASFALREAGFETIMVNSNPETVSTDYDTSDRLYFEPLTLEDVLHIYRREQCDGAIVQFGGQTPLNLAADLEKNGVRIIGTSPASIEAAEDRKVFQALAARLGIKQATTGYAASIEEAEKVAEQVGYPVLIRPSFVLGGRAMVIAYDQDALRKYIVEAVEVSEDRVVQIDHYLEDALEVDVDCISDGETSVIGAIMEHIELAGVHSGDSACVIPAPSLTAGVKDAIRKHTFDLATALNVCGLMNIQYAIKDNEVYVLEVNPRASRTVPYVSKTIGVPLAKLAALVMVGRKLKDLGFTQEITPRHVSVKEAVFPFARFPGIDVILSPEMKSTGEVMGIDARRGLAFLKSQIAAGNSLPGSGNIFMSIRDEDKPGVIPLAKRLIEHGFTIYATVGTSTVLRDHGVKSNAVFRISKGRPNVVDMMEEKSVKWIINTSSSGAESRIDEIKMRASAVMKGIPITTTIDALRAAINGLETLREMKHMEVCSLQEYHRHAPRLNFGRATTA